MNALTHIIAASLVAAGTVACGRPAAPTDRAPTPEAVTVRVAPAVVIDTTERLEAGGVVSAMESAAVSSRIVATVATVRVKSGDRVHAGDVLITLDAPDVTARTEEARASALAAEKALTQARSDVRAAEAEQHMAAAWQQRIAALHARNSATTQERDEAETRLAAAGARLAGAEAGADGADARLAAARAAVAAASAGESFSTLRAPFDGVITERLIDPGGLASPGVPLLRIESSGARQVVVRVDAARLPYIHPGDRATIRSDASDGPPAADKAVEGIVTEVAQTIAADQQAFTVKLLVPRSFAARSGSFARVEFRGVRRRALVVPPDAVLSRGQVTSVYVAQQGVARLRLIQAGAAFPEGVEILAGIDAGESIVIAPPARLTDGATVVIAPTPTRGAR